MQATIVMTYSPTDSSNYVLNRIAAVAYQDLAKRKIVRLRRALDHSALRGARWLRCGSPA
jgi:hypothetical protein